MKHSNDGSTIILSLERYLELLACETKIQMIESARQTMKGYSFDSFMSAMFPFPEADADA